MLPFRPGVAFFGVDVRQVRWVALHPTPFASRVEAFVLQHDEVLGMDIAEVTLHHPAAV